MELGDTTKTILLVEDEAIIAMSEERLLQKGGYAVRRAPSGEEAIAAATEVPPQE